MGRQGLKPPPIPHSTGAAIEISPPPPFPLKLVLKMMSVKLASYSYSFSASSYELPQNVYIGRYHHAEHEYDIRFALGQTA